MNRSRIFAYYWRGEHGLSRDLWCSIVDKLQRSLDYKYLRAPERVRAQDGMAFADHVLRTNEAPLGNPSAVRMIP
jgi:hypothetical protein